MVITRQTELYTKLKQFLTDLVEVKQVNISNLHSFLDCDHISFTTLNVSTKHIASTNRIVVSLTKNSARSFYLKQLNSVLAEKTNPPKIDLKDDCLAQIKEQMPPLHKTEFNHYHKLRRV